MRTLLLAAGAALTAAACAPYPPVAPAQQAAAAPARQCFHSGRVNGYREAGRDHVDLTVGANEVWRVRLFGACPDIDWTNQIGVVRRGGGSYICDGFDVEFVVPNAASGPPRRCAARSVRRLTPAEAAAPPPR